MAKRFFEQKDGKSKDRHLFSVIDRVVFPTQKEVFHPHVFYEESKWLYLPPLFYTKILSCAEDKEPYPTRPYALGRLNYLANDTTIQKNLPQDTFVTPREEGVLTHLPHVSLVSLSGFGFMLYDSLFGSGKGTKLIMDERFVNQCYVLGDENRVYTVCARWREPLKRWFLFVREFDDRGLWHSDNRVLFPLVA